MTIQIKDVVRYRGEVTLTVKDGKELINYTELSGDTSGLKEIIERNIEYKTKELAPASKEYRLRVEKKRLHVNKNYLESYQKYVTEYTKSIEELLQSIAKIEAEPDEHKTFALPEDTVISFEIKNKKTGDVIKKWKKLTDDKKFNTGCGSNDKEQGQSV